jgi:hypothetical protein
VPVGKVIANVRGSPLPLALSASGLTSFAVFTPACFIRLFSVIAWPLRLSSHGITIGFTGEPARPMVDANGMPISMCVAWFSPSDSLSRITAHDASFDTTELMPNFLKKPSSCAMTIGEQSVSAMIPNRMFGVSGESSAYTLPTQPPGRPSISVAAALTAAARLRNVRRDVLVI